ncbi:MULTISPECIES: hypothetical protein [Brevibacterium]|uniref:Uncharacterized protein n=1 Tax=Brevibacterium luteolum TaxID=199591 RepID=A0A2N6PKB7_9MICO|nr:MULTISPECIES: hypothetical protein [Brevibacterium]MCT1690312.1 hypothetical protein [Brevibacterium sp. p3-SID960]PMB99142.1 hypothetical protein CJ198_00965 [Brevibacterium luteolum]QIN28531.1 hypothetical protein EW640_03980 [Brevibacterium luteolum]
MNQIPEPNPEPLDAEGAPALDPRHALEIATSGQRTISRREQRAGILTSLLWSVAWLVAYSAMAAASVFGLMPTAIAGIIFAGGMTTALIATSIINMRAASGRRGPAARQGTLYGVTWALVVTVIIIASMQVGTYLPDPEVIGWLANAIAVFGVGIMIVMGGILFSDRIMFGFGIGAIVALIISLLVGPALFTLVFIAAALAGLIVSIIALARTGREADRS